MDLKRLGHLIALADEGNFSRAALRVHLSQPAFSRSIQAAETEMGVRLFDRRTSDVTCTPAGTFVVERGRHLMQESRRLDRDVLLFRQGMIGRLCIGAGPFVAAAMLPQMLTWLRNEYPNVEARVQVGNARSMLAALRSEELDFFVSETREVPRDGTLDITVLGGQRVGFYVRRGHPLLSQEEVHGPDVLPYGIATMHLPPQVHVRLLKLLGLPPEAPLPLALECDDTHLTRLVAMSTDTVMIGNSDVLAAEIAAGDLVRVTLAGVAATFTEIGVVSLAGRTHSPVAFHAIAYLRRESPADDALTKKLADHAASDPLIQSASS